VVEFLALPLVHTAWLTAVVFGSPTRRWLLAHRIRARTGRWKRPWPAAGDYR
jgi:isoprenylcysteine carboxyl methyltransferase (ICMT) family protein YpbQ